MNRDEAKLMLAGFRANGADASDPDMAEAVAFARNDTELGDWFERERAFDRAVADQLERLHAPLDVKREILAGRRVAGWGVKRRFQWMPLAAAAAIALAFIGGLFLGQSGRSVDASYLAEFRQEMVELIPKGVALDVQSADLDDLIGHVALQSAPRPEVFPEILHGQTPMGCKVIDWKGKKVALFCFKKGEGDIVHLFVAQLGANSPLAANERVIARARNFPTISWTEGGRHYLLAGHTPQTDLSAYY